MANYPAIDIATVADDLLYAELDDHSPIAIEEHAHGVRVFFATAPQRDAAANLIGQRFQVSPIEVPDEDWARRSQENLPPIVVGRIRIVTSRESASRESASHESASHESAGRASASHESRGTDTIVITPSMGFGTGHHATTRLCLEALQTIDLHDKSVLDVGTGSGVLAIAAARLGAARAVGIDVDPDAVQAARENLALNPEAAHVTFEVADLQAIALPPFDVVVANLTGAMLVRMVSALSRLTAAGGTLIVSGLLNEERDEVRGALAPMEVASETGEDEWTAIAVKKP